MVGMKSIKIFQILCVWLTLGYCAINNFECPQLLQFPQGFSMRIIVIIWWPDDYESTVRSLR
jgi:hypothetical protein